MLKSVRINKKFSSFARFKLGFGNITVNCKLTVKDLQKIVNLEIFSLRPSIKEMIAQLNLIWKGVKIQFSYYQLNHFFKDWTYFSTQTAFSAIRGGGPSVDGRLGALPPLTPGLEDLLAEKVRNISIFKQNKLPSTLITVKFKGIHTFFQIQIPLF